MTPMNNAMNNNAIYNNMNPMYNNMASGPMVGMVNGMAPNTMNPNMMLNNHQNFPINNNNMMANNFNNVMPTNNQTFGHLSSFNASYNSSGLNGWNTGPDYQQAAQDQKQLYSMTEQIDLLVSKEPDNHEFRMLSQELKTAIFQPYNPMRNDYLKQQFAKLTANKPASPRVMAEDGFGSGEDYRRDYDPFQILYGALPLQCKTCALRFKDNEPMRKHMDWHWRMNKKEKKKKEKKQAMSRAWYIEEDEWMQYTAGETEVYHEQPALPFLNNRHKKEDDQKPLPNMVADDDQPECPICREKFDKFWDETNEEWMYLAVEINERMDKITYLA
ncbi:hypothetical protein SAMD00019534_038660 [Acytostelium subglobosum LB1]|uniref:hypothetical protein n=1 Tax=Acytostelium subglobosum LB1 TaxID=1410327 RepID=UPI000645036E|nr:hypothetical protein SAMD00019534_038660 [Acytostelium subglobosum LB1]GAM20691.1 hypothetical protein SAMD00019534_038660 [Acytostelium subglobosum LB1]|eukprot:XP_012760212.1 hypothetical protein SAMD00019534_038660 [Acytostelium subglobosum LB1]